MVRTFGNAPPKPNEEATPSPSCLIIPIDDNPGMFLGKKGCYLYAVAYETQNNQYGDTHMVKPDLPRDVRERMTEDERRNQPILGNMRPMQPHGRHRQRHHAGQRLCKRPRRR